MATDKTPNYSADQENIILAAVRENGNIANLALAEKLAADPRMNGADGPRKPRGITAKMSRMAEAGGFKYERKAPTTKDGQPVVKKLDAVKEIARLAGVDFAKLDGMEKAPKLALDTIRTALADMAEAA